MKTTKMDKDKKDLELLTEVARKEIARNPGYLVADGDVRILMPMQVAMMRTNLSKMQQDIILAILERIKRQLHSVLSGDVAPGNELSLFTYDELQGEDRKIQLKMYFKEFGVAAQNYPKLASAMAMLPYIPVQFPYTTPDGKAFYKHTNFCSVYIPQDLRYNKYCYVTIESDVAHHVMNFDLGHLYVGKRASRKMKTKYSERIYWIVKAHLNNGGVIISTKELRKMLGLENKYKNFNAFELNVLQNSAEEIKNLFLLNECECWFTYDKIFNDKEKKHAEPDAIKFTCFSNKKAANILDAKLEKIEKGVKEEIFSTMVDDLGVSKSNAEKYMKFVTDENCNSFLAYLISLKSAIDERRENGKPIKNKVMYVVSSLGNFFSGKEAEKKKTTSNQSKTFDYHKTWITCQQKICEGKSQQEIDDIYSCPRLVKYDDQKKLLVLQMPSHKIYQEFEERIDSVAPIIKRYFGEDVKLQYSIAKSEQQK